MDFKNAKELLQICKDHNLPISGMMRRRLPAELRETALGGCAATPTGCGLCAHP